VPGALVDGEFVPDWLTAADQPWLRELLLATLAFAGQPFAALRAAWRCLEVPPPAGARWRPVLAALQRRVLAGPRPAAAPLRARVFAAVAAGRSRAEVLAAEAAGHGSVAAVEAALFADLGDQRLVQWPTGSMPTRCGGRPTPPSRRDCWPARTPPNSPCTGRAGPCCAPRGCRARTSGAWAGRTAWRACNGCRRPAMATRAGASRRSCRCCRGRGASCCDRSAAGACAPRSWCRRSTHWHRVRRQPPSTARSNANSLRRWRARGSASKCEREPAPVPLGDHLAFPDFALGRRRARSEALWWLELAGLRDPSALPGKVALLHRLPRYVLCLPHAKCPDELRAHPRVLTFRRGRVADVAVALRAVVAGTAGAVSRSPPEGAAQ
jgi:hypothetical protein